MKKVVWSGGADPVLLAGFLIWREDCPDSCAVAPLRLAPPSLPFPLRCRRLRARVKDVQLKEVPWDQLGQEDSSAALRVEVRHIRSRIY